jgi:hypothetical protein
MTQAWASRLATYPYQKASYKFVATPHLVTTSAQTSPSAFPTNHLDMYGREVGKENPSGGEFYNYERSGKMWAVAEVVASNFVPSMLHRFSNHRGRPVIICIASGYEGPEPTAQRCFHAVSLRRP